MMPMNDRQRVHIATAQCTLELLGKEDWEAEWLSKQLDAYLTKHQLSEHRSRQD